MSLILEMDNARIANQIAKLARVRKVPLQEAVRDAGRLFLRYVMSITPPGSKFDLKTENWTEKRMLGERTVSTDIRKRFLTTDNIRLIARNSGSDIKLGDRLKRAAEREDGTLVKRLENLGLHIEKVTRVVNKEDHRRARNYRGRVKGGLKVLVASSQSVKAYLKAQTAKVGRAIHGWTKAASALGFTRYPAWVKRQTGSTGIFMEVKSDVAPYIIVGNDVPYIQAAGLESRIIDRSARNVARNLPKQVEATMKAIQRKMMR